MVPEPEDSTKHHSESVTDSTITRRSALAVVGSALSFAGCLTTGVDPEDADSIASADDDGSDTESGGPENGAVVFVYDDGPNEDIEKALPAHQEYDAPATTGIVSEWVGRPQYMDADDLDTLADNGWEIASHTRTHTTVGAFYVVEDLHPSETEVNATGYRHGHHEGRDVQLSDGNKSVIREVKGLAGDPGDRRVELAEPVGDYFRAEDTEIRYPADTMHEMLGGSKEALEEMGHEVTSLLAPYDVYSGWSDLFVPEYYDAVANVRPGSRINYLADGSFDPYRTRRDYFLEFTSKEAVKSDLDEIAERGHLGVFGAHAMKGDVSEEGIERTLGWAEERGIEIITLREAAKRFGFNSS